jgi:hypothetical protein
MPSYRFPSALIALYYSDTNQSPWNYPRWQEVTGIKHGLFPEDDALLPHGWDRSAAKEILSFFEQFKQIKGEDDRKRFASKIGQPVHPGRDKWLKFCTWLWQKAKLTTIIVDAMRTGGYHPIDILRNSPAMPGQPQSFPHYGDYLSSLGDIVGSALFGDEALNLNVGNGVVLSHLRGPLTGFIARVWEGLKSTHNTTMSKLPVFEAEAERALKGKSFQRHSYYSGS